MGGEQNVTNNKITRVVNVEKRRPRILYIQGEPVWEFKFIRRAVDDYPDIGIDLPTMLRTTQNKIYHGRAEAIPRNSRTAFRPSPKSCSRIRA